MGKRTDIRKVLIIGSGPIVIGQAAEFDYAGTQACIALREEGYEVILCNSNPATIMTDPQMADKVYMEPLSADYVARIIRRERPDAIIPGLGGQTGLNLAVELDRQGVLAECGVQLLGTPKQSIEKAEDRELFKELCTSIGEPVIPSEITYNLEQAKKAALDIGYPVVLRPAFTLGGTGGGFVNNELEMEELGAVAFRLSPVGQVLVEKSVKGFREIEFEVMRDASGRTVTICGMENVDPVGVHTGDSIVVAPILSLTPGQLDMLEKSALKIISALKIEGGCNVQFALDPEGDDYFLIEVNPRVSRSSALASKASGYPIARVTAKVALGMLLDEIPVAGGLASKQPVLDYIVAKFPRFPFDKFSDAPNTLGTQMKATGEVMGIGSNLCECILKSVRSLETGVCHLHMTKFDGFTQSELLDYISEFRDDNIFAVTELLRRGVTVGELHSRTMINHVFLECLREIVEMEGRLRASVCDPVVLAQAKKMGFCDCFIARLWGCEAEQVTQLRHQSGLRPVFRMVDTLHTGLYIPYLYSSYGGANDSVVTDRDKIVVLGSGPIRIGQGIEFDYSTVHAVQTIRRYGYEAIVINNNPETVSTDYTVSDKLYFEPLTVEDVMEIIDFEKPLGVIVTLGGQTAINLADALAQRGVNIIGTGQEAVDRAEDRDLFEKLLLELDIPRPEGCAVTDVDTGLTAAAEIGYPVLVRPSFVLGGRAMQLVFGPEQLRHYLSTAISIEPGHPVLVDKYVRGREVEVDAICDGQDVFVPGIMELIERTGVHSGDSISVFPCFSLSEKVRQTIVRYTQHLALGIGIRGLLNIQFIVDPQDRVSVIEVNPRSSRTVPFLSKATGCPLADIATAVMLGHSLKEQGVLTVRRPEGRFYVKVPVFSFAKIKGADAYLSPEMKSTGEAIGYDRTLNRALYKALQASGMAIRNWGNVLVTVAKAPEDRQEILPLVRRFCTLGFGVLATEGTAAFLSENGIDCTVLKKLSEGSDDIPKALASGKVSYVLNTKDLTAQGSHTDGQIIRSCAIQSGVTMFTSIDTARALLDVLDETTMGISPIQAAM